LKRFSNSFSRIPDAKWREHQACRILASGKSLSQPSCEAQTAAITMAADHERVAPSSLRRGGGLSFFDGGDQQSVFVYEA
jgi:hypothetical protein